MKSLRFFIEALFVRIGLALIDILPLDTAIKMAEILASFWFSLTPKRRKIAVDNIIKAGITGDPSEASRIAKASFEHFGIIIVESLKSNILFKRDNWQDHVTTDLPEQLKEDLANKRGGLLVATGHFGNWEIAGHVLSTYKPVAGITTRFKNPRVDQIMKDRRPQGDFSLVQKKARDQFRFLDVLKAGSVLAIVTDQHGGNNGRIVDFFGHPASTHTTIAMLHLVTKAPLYFGYAKRTGSLQYKIKVTGPITVPEGGTKGEKVHAILAKLNAELETVIRECPEQYLWAHRRWRPEDLERARAGQISRRL